MEVIILKFWILSAASSISNAVNAMQSSSPPNDQSPNNEMPSSSSSSIFDPVRAYAAAVVLETEIEITISAKKLDGPLTSSGACLKPDPMCVISTHSSKSGYWTEYQRTEFLSDNRNPEFAQKVLMPLSSVHENMSLLFSVYSYFFWSTTVKRDLKDHTILGYASCQLEELVERGRVELSLGAKTIDSEKVRKVKGRVIVHAEKLIANYDQVVIRFAGINVKQKGLFGRRKSYIEIHKLLPESHEYVLAHRTNVVERSANPQWEAFTIPLKNLCNGSYHRFLKFSYWEWVSRAGNVTSRTFVGQFITTLGEIIERNARDEKTFDLENPRRLVRKGSGQFEVDLHVLEVPAFSEFIRAGLRIRCIIAVDFSKANGDPNLKDSLHHRKVNDTASSLNQYEEALTSVVDILGNFGWDKKLTFMSYGARYPDTANNSEIECDQLVDITECSGTEDVLKAYRENLMKYEDFDRRANLIPILQTVTSAAKARDSPRDYFILFVLTSDGMISSTEEAERIISEASTLPVSIILMAIGRRKGPFASLEELRKKQKESGNRDTLHFLSFDDCRSFYEDHDYPDDSTPNSFLSCLATRILAKLPNQVMSHMQSKGYTPDYIPLEPLQYSQPSSSAPRPDAPEETRSVDLPLVSSIPSDNKVSSSELSSPISHPDAPDETMSINLPLVGPFIPIDEVSSAEATSPSAGEFNLTLEPHSPVKNTPSHFAIPPGISAPVSPSNADVPPTRPLSSSIYQVDEDSNEGKVADVKISYDPPSPRAGIFSNSPTTDIDAPELVSRPSSSDYITAIDFSNLGPPPDVPSQSSIQLTGVRPLHLAVGRRASSSDDSSLYGTPTSHLSSSSQRGRESFSGELSHK